jgi:hypothetical protein
MRQFRVESGLIIEFQAGSKLLWKPRGRWAFPPPRLRRLAEKLRCRATDHRWRDWRVETRDWFEYVEEPELWAWRHCSRCAASEHVIAKYGT